MHAVKVMTRPVVTVPADATVWSAADILLGARISAAPVVEPDGRMVGIVSEAVGHAISRDHDGIPIRNFYFDATSSNMDRDLDIFMELAVAYGRRKKRRRRYPRQFG